MLRLENLEITQGAFHLGANWVLPAGCKAAIIGPSGAGKSTLLMALAGFIRPSAGKITWRDQDLALVPPGERPLSILFQDQNLFPHLTIAQNLGLGLSPRLKLSPRDWQAVETTLDRVGLGGMGGRRPAQLSGGQLGRAALARALLRARPMLLLDEPFAALGPALKADMLDLVLGTTAEAGTTVLMVTHDPADARRFADLTILVADGLAHAPQPTGALFANPPQALQDYLGK